MGVFLGVIVVGVAVMVTSVRLLTADQLRRRVLSDDVAQANALASLLAGFYSQNQSWNGVEAEFRVASAPTTQTELPPGGMMWPGMMGPGMMWNWQGWVQVTQATGPVASRVVVLDGSGRVVADTGQASTHSLQPVHFPIST